MSYRDFALTVMPPWLRGYYGEAWASTWGFVADAMAQAATDAIGTRLIARRTVEALPYAGLDRGIEAAYGESAESYRARLLAAWDSWHAAGTVPGLLTQLSAIDMTATLEESLGGDWWNFGVTITGYPSDMLIAPDPALHYWGDVGLSWGGVAFLYADQIRRIIRRFKSAHSICTRITVLGPDVKRWGQASTYWGDGHIWSGTIYALDPGPA